MNSNRRDFLFGTPLSLIALAELAGTPLEGAATQSSADADALHFWMNGMGLSPSLIPSAGADAVRGAQSKGPNAGPTVASFIREPVFLHWDERDGTLVDATQIDRKLLLDSGDTQVDLQLQRLRLNSDDHAHFARYTSGAIYLEMAQGGQPSQSTTSGPSMSDTFMNMASSTFGAFFPAHTGSAPAPKPKGGGGKKGALEFWQQPAGAQATSRAKAGAPLQLQTPRDAQSLPLPKGVGRGAFSAFVKDPRRTVFGQFLSALVGPDSSSTYSALLSISFMAAPALKAIQAIVSNLQLQGGNQAIVMQAPKIDIATTQEAMSGLSGIGSALPLRSGSYIAVPREHASLIKNELNNYQILNGFVVPKGASNLDVTPDMVQQTLDGLTYISLGVNVKKTKLNPCMAQA